MSEHDAGAPALDMWRRALRIAAGSEAPDLLLRGGQVVNVLTGEIERANVAIADGRIVGVGDYVDGNAIVDLDGAYLAPSFIDGHIHTESSLLWLPEFARAVVPHGTGAVVTDPHEIANVAGLAGFTAYVAASHGLPLGMHFTVPSCVPASPRETAGATLSAADIADGMKNPSAVGLGEMMNFPGVLAGEADIFSKLQAATGRRDGHAPGLRGRAVDGYVFSGMQSDHEATTPEEGRDKLRRGLMLMLREGSSARNMLALLPLVTDSTYPRCCFCSDDRDCATLLHDGHMDATLRMAVAAGLDPLRAIRLATFNVADYWRLERVGAVAPGFWANLVTVDDLRDFRVGSVYFQGKLVARDGVALFDAPRAVPAVLRDTLRVAPLTRADLRLDPADARVAVGAIDRQIVTRLLDVEPTLADGAAVADPRRDLLKLVCVERHHATGNVGVGYVQGFGLQHGALASSIAHDAHNIIAVGVDDDDILAAIAGVVALQGGLVAVADGETLAQLALPIAGLLSDQPLEATSAAYGQLEAVAARLGSKLHSPFGLLAFMALSVIPEARVTDQGFMRL
jgi:adenine deaminase